MKTLILSFVIVLCIGAIAYQQVQITSLQENVQFNEARSLLPESRGTCERLLMYEPACASPWIAVIAQDHVEPLSFYYTEPASHIDIIVDGTVVDSIQIDTTVEESNTTIRGIRIVIRADLKPGTYDAQIITRPSNESVVIPLIVLESILDLR
ncbi:MAG: hypothetical protein ACMXYM_04110 [Candidatus Woesearchaeota archaeon]